MRLITLASAAVASASLALAQTPGATIVNNCATDVYVWEVADDTPPSSTLSPGASLTKPFITRASGGVSIKMGWVNDIWVKQPLTQFEYTWTPGDSFGGLWYDMSNIDGDPFQDYLTEITPNLMSGVSNTTKCSTVTCPPGGHCVDAYNIPTDNQVVKTCPDKTNLVFNLCGSGSGSSGSSAPASSPAPASSSAPASTPAPSSTPAPATTTTAAPVQQTPPAHVQAAVPETTIVTMTVHAAATPGPNAFAPAWTDDDSVVREGAIHKREAHENHMERHARIARMHHARSA